MKQYLATIALEAETLDEAKSRVTSWDTGENAKILGITGPPEQWMPSDAGPRLEEGPPPGEPTPAASPATGELPKREVGLSESESA